MTERKNKEKAAYDFMKKQQQYIPSCHFITYFSEHDFYIDIEMRFNALFWENQLKPKLDEFYHDYYLPELYIKTQLLRTQYFSFKNDDFEDKKRKFFDEMESRNMKIE